MSNQITSDPPTLGSIPDSGKCQNVESKQMCVIKLDRTLGRSPGLVVTGDDSCLRGCGFESRHRILDGYFSH